MINAEKLPDKTILCVDDEEKTLSALRRVLRVFSCNILDAGDGEEALSVVREEPPDLIILDVRMPRMDGYEFLKHLREIDNDIPVIMLTGDSSSEGLMKGYSQGAVCYITKPFKNEYVINAVRLFIGSVSEEEKQEIEMSLAGI